MPSVEGSAQARAPHLGDRIDAISGSEVPTTAELVLDS
jgi:hypothetical protein